MSDNRPRAKTEGSGDQLLALSGNRVRAKTEGLANSCKRRSPRRPSTTALSHARGNTTNAPLLPEPLTGALKIEDALLSDVPTTEALSAWLDRQGLDTSTWGTGNTKSVSKFWKEIKLEEAGLELWKKADQVVQPVRVVHVLRAKVCSPDSYDCGVFLFNTWQQFGDGRTRVRNGLLSEKLSTSELPLQDHLHDVCVRAVCEEEMQFVVDAACKIAPGDSPPDYGDGESSLLVVDEHFVDHTVEIEESKSFPGLLTMYHLYTVEILCDNLPLVDFNTLEWDGTVSESGKPPKLKYIHAWTWLEWRHIQRYLFEGSTMKERKGKGSFQDAAALQKWLSQFAIPLQVWGSGKYRGINDLFKEVDSDATQLELWSRHDGVPLLMRVVHVIQLKVKSADGRQQQGKFLFQVWQQSKNGEMRTVNQFLSSKIPTANMQQADFHTAAKQVIQQSLAHIVDNTYRMRSDSPPLQHEVDSIDIEVIRVESEGHHFDLKESPTYKGMHTMYHLYTMEVTCEGLPLTHFTTMNFHKAGGPYVEGWRWATWEESLDIVHGQFDALERQEQTKMYGIQQAHAGVQMLLEQVNQMAEKAKAARAAQRIEDGGSAKCDSGSDEEEQDEDWHRLQQLADGLEGNLGALAADNDNAGNSLAMMLPPSMVSKMAENTISEKESAKQTAASSGEHVKGQSTKDAPQAVRGNQRTPIVGSTPNLFIGNKKRGTVAPELISPAPGARQETPIVVGSTNTPGQLQDAALQASSTGLQESGMTPPCRLAAVRDAAKKEFLSSGADVSGFIEREYLMNVIQNLCPARTSDAEALLDTLGRDNDAGRVPCAAFLDYVFSD